MTNAYMKNKTKKMSNTVTKL